jgi:hypothetical protein
MIYGDLTKSNLKKEISLDFRIEVKINRNLIFFETTPGGCPVTILPKAHKTYT